MKRGMDWFDHTHDLNVRLNHVKPFLIAPAA